MSEILQKWIKNHQSIDDKELNELLAVYPFAHTLQALKRNRHNLNSSSSILAQLSSRNSSWMMSTMVQMATDIPESHDDSKEVDYNRMGVPGPSISDDKIYIREVEKIYEDKSIEEDKSSDIEIIYSSQPLTSGNNTFNHNLEKSDEKADLDIINMNNEVIPLRDLPENPTTEVIYSKSKKAKKNKSKKPNKTKVFKKGKHPKNTFIKSEKNQSTSPSNNLNILPVISTSKFSSWLMSLKKSIPPIESDKTPSNIISSKPYKNYNKEITESTENSSDAREVEIKSTLLPTHDKKNDSDIETDGKKKSKKKKSETRKKTRVKKKKKARKKSKVKKKKKQERKMESKRNKIKKNKNQIKGRKKGSVLKSLKRQRKVKNNSFLKSPKKKIKTKKKLKLRSKKNSLIKIDHRFISEAMANLLWKQGYRKKSIRMMEILSLKNPEKRAYFTARIKKLKKK